MQFTNQEPLKDADRAHPIPDVWRPQLREIVKAFVRGDYGLSRAIPGVTPVTKATADQIRGYLTDFGDSLVELPDETWDSSVSQWMGTHWDVLVDLWTIKSGRSDLVLNVHVFESNKAFRFEVDSVHVP